MKFTTVEMRQINCRKVYDFIYENRVVSKQMIANDLKMSIPTIAQDINYLMKKDLVCEYGHAKSSGGRPPVLYQCNDNARVAVGVEVMINCVNIYAVNIAGDVIRHSSLTRRFTAEEEYYRTVCGAVTEFIESLELPSRTLLGVAVAIQGIVSMDGESVVYSGVLNNSKITRADFASRLKWPCVLIHDSDAAGYAETRHDKDIEKAAYIYLNPYFGSTMILDGKVIQDEDISSGIFAHMCLYPGGRKCYCGKRGCVDAYCSANALEKEAEMDLDQFFALVRKKDEQALAVWKRYLNNLAITMNNIRMVINCDFVIGGKLEKYLTADDYETLKEYARNANAFNSAKFRVKEGYYGDKAAPIGAALTLIDEFLEQI